MTLKTCIVTYTDADYRRSVEVMAETLNEAAVLGLKAMNVPGERLHLLSLDVLVKAPQVYHSISGASLSVAARHDHNRACRHARCIDNND